MSTTAKHIIIPADVAIARGPTLPPIVIPFRKTTEAIIDSDPVFHRPASNARAAARLLESLDAALAAGDPVWTIPNGDDHEMLAKAVERWLSGMSLYNGNGEKTGELPARHFLRHIDAIAEPRVKDPRPELPPLSAAQKAEAEPAHAEPAPAN